jgi:hypothetical protein
MQVLLLTAGCVSAVRGGADVTHYSLLDNLEEKLSQEGIRDQIVFGTPHKKYVPILEGGELLLQYVEAQPEFRKDHLWSRLAHTHPFSTVAYREEDNPSAHVVFLRRKDGTLKADIHLDGNGPQKLFPHLDEFIFHKLTFQNNNQDVMHANLQRAFLRQASKPAEPFITRRERTLQYLHATFGFQPLTQAIGNGMFRHYARQFIWKTEPHYEPIANRVEASLVRYTLRNTLEFGVANWRQEDTRYRPSGRIGFANRFRAALVNTFVVATPTGREFAYARFAGIAGSTAIIDKWHPWRAYPFRPNYARQATLNLAVDPLARSLWAEFGPDLKRKLPFRFR